MGRPLVSTVLLLTVCAAVFADPPYPPDRVVRLPPVDPLEQVVRLPPVDEAGVWPPPTLPAAAAEVIQGGNQVVWASPVEPPPTQPQPQPQQPVPMIVAEPGLGGEAIRLPPVDVEPVIVPPRGFKGLFEDVLSDHCNFYSWPSMAGLAVGLGVGAVMANTSIDERLRDAYQENIRSSRTDEYSEAFHSPKFLGDGRYTLPVFAGATLLECWCDEGSIGYGVGKWGERSLRTALVGAPPMLLLQSVIGAGRPGGPEGSEWTSFRNNNGVSGHAFMGAIPFLTAAKMVESPLWKTAFYAGSIFPGFSRFNDDQHYASQVILGWWMAYLAATAVDQTETARNWLKFGPMPMADGVGVGLEIRH